MRLGAIRMRLLVVAGICLFAVGGWVLLIQGENGRDDQNKHYKFVDRIRGDVHGFDRLNDFDRIDAVREWVYGNTDVSATTEFLLSYKKYPLHNMSVDAIFDLSKDNVGGFWCSGIAFSLKRAYEALGYKAWVYSYGDKNSLTHAVTLVETGDYIYVQDAYFNISYVDQTGRPVPLYELLKELATRKKMVVKAGAITLRDIHFKSIKQTETGWTSVGLDQRNCKAAKGHLICRSQTTHSAFVEKHFLRGKTFDFLGSRGLPRDFQYLMLFPYAVNADSYITDPENSEILRVALQIASTVNQE